MAPGNLKQALAGLTAAVAGTVGAHLLRDLPWGLAGLVGLAIGVLTISALRSSARVRAAWRNDAANPD